MRARDLALFVLLLAALIAIPQVWPPIAAGEAREGCRSRARHRRDWVLPRRQGCSPCRPLSLARRGRGARIRVVGRGRASAVIAGAWSTAVVTFALASCSGIDDPPVAVGICSPAGGSPARLRGASTCCSRRA
jgi:hypothetical protein